MRLNAANVRHDRGEIVTAAHHLERALELDPENALAWNNLAAIRLEQGRLEEAEEAARRGLDAEHLDEDQDLYKLHCNLGIILRARDRPRAAVDPLATCLHLEPAFLRPWEELSALARAGTLGPEEMEEILAAGRDRDPDSPYWALYDGFLEHLRGDWRTAITTLRSALAEIPEHGAFPRTRARGRLVLADALLRQGHREEAAAELRRLVADPFAPPGVRDTATRALGDLDSGSGSG